MNGFLWVLVFIFYILSLVLMIWGIYVLLGKVSMPDYTGGVILTLSGLGLFLAVPVPVLMELKNKRKQNLDDVTVWR